MELSVTCPACGGNQFVEAYQINAETADDTLITCAGCGGRTAKGALIAYALDTNSGRIRDEALSLADKIAANAFRGLLK